MSWQNWIAVGLQAVGLMATIHDLPPLREPISPAKAVQLTAAMLIMWWLTVSR